MAFEIIKVKEDFYKLVSDDGKTYYVDLEKKSCTCPHTFYNPDGTLPCKHVIAVMTMLGQDPYKELAETFSGDDIRDIVEGPGWREKSHAEDRADGGP